MSETPDGWFEIISTNGRVLAVLELCDHLVAWLDLRPASE